MTLAAPAASDASSLRLLEPPARLRVPLATHAPADVPPGITVGAVVAKGQPLTPAPTEGGPHALAPTSGRIVGVDSATLTNGHAVPVVELEVDFEDRPA